jgi:hypothetical protein
MHQVLNLTLFYRNHLNGISLNGISVVPRCRQSVAWILLGLARVEERAVVASFEGRTITTNAGGLLLRATVSLRVRDFWGQGAKKNTFVA